MSQGFDWSSLGRNIQQGLGLFQTGTQIAGGLAGAFGGNDPGARDFSTWANRLGQGAGQINSLVGGFSGQAAPSQGFPPAASFPPAAGFPPTAAFAPAPMFPPLGGLPPPMMTGMPAGLPPQFMAPVGAQAAAPANATALMALLMNNPQIMQALQSAPFSPTPQGVAVNLPNQAPVSIPLNAVMNTIAQLAQASMRELSAMPGENEQDVPNYLLTGDGSFIVDPDDPQQRAALALHWLRAGAEAQRYESPRAFAFGETGFDEAEAWAREAGFDD